MTQDENIPPVPPFDYDALRDETAGKAIGEVYQVMANNAALLVEASKMDATQDMIEATYAKLASEIMAIIVKNKIVNSDFNWFMDKAVDHLMLPLKAISKHKNNFEDELLAYVMEAKNPGPTGEHSMRFATLEGLMKALEVQRRAHGIK